uniref:Reverse transcriptase/retrotransposon-derived protein RNase H-like domain-containing protein n=1 Tax=Amphimedon queenslandica TaxID=400682 RepID=A0A1X7TSQ7_AMPQE
MLFSLERILTTISIAYNRFLIDYCSLINLRIKHAKCELLQKKVHSLENVVSEKGVSTDPAKTEKDRGWPVPTSQNQLRQFVGLASYCRWFVQDFATISQPLHRLMGKRSQFVWTPDCQMAFHTLQSKLTSRPILAFPDFTSPFILDTNASVCGIGAVLSQNQEGHKQVVAYASRALSKLERNYGVTRRKLLNVITFVSFSSVCTFTICTDHNSLNWLNSFKEAEGQVASWLEKFAEFYFKIEHCPGLKCSNPDSLLRVLPAFTAQIASNHLQFSVSELSERQLQDNTIVQC